MSLCFQDFEGEVRDLSGKYAMPDGRLLFAPKMGKALELYRSHGFCEIPAYYNNPNSDVLFMELDL